MKKIMTLVMFMFIATLSLHAEDYNAAQERLRTEIMEYTRSQGYKTEKQSDGLKFTKDGINYYVEISDNDNNPMYLRTCRYISYNETLTKDLVRKNINDLNAKYAVKIVPLDDSILVTAEMFLGKASEYTSILTTLTSQIDSGVESLKELK